MRCCPACPACCRLATSVPPPAFSGSAAASALPGCALHCRCRKPSTFNTHVWLTAAAAAAWRCRLEPGAAYLVIKDPQAYLDPRRIYAPRPDMMPPPPPQR